MLSATLNIDGIPEPEVRLHNAASDDAPYVFVGLGRYGSAVNLYGDHPDDFRRIAAALLEAAEQLTTAIDGRAPGAPEVAAS